MTRFPSPETKYTQVTLEARREADLNGTLRDKVRFDLIPRPAYAFGMLAAADAARFFGFSAVTAIEFGVAEGDGLLNLCHIAELVTANTGITFDIVGFDTGTGLPRPKDYRDHPEIWTAGDFTVPDRRELTRKLAPNARIVWGDVAETLPDFISSVSPARPVGFVSVDFDIYSSTAAGLKLFNADSARLLPAVITYFDDTFGGAARIGSLFRNRRAGQLLAIDEFNAGHPHRVLDLMRILKYRRPLDREQWIEQMYVAHILDHPARNTGGTREPLSTSEHASVGGFEWPL